MRHPGEKAAFVRFGSEAGARRVTFAAETNMLGEIAAVLRSRTTRRRRDRGSGFRAEKQEFAEFEDEVRALPDLMTNRRKTLEIARHGERIVIGHPMEPLVRNDGREQPPIFAFPVPQRPHDFSFTPASETCFDV